MNSHPTEIYRPANPIRIVSSGSLFDGHDAAINIMRRMLQGSGAEVIHLGHNRSVQEIVDCAVQEDANAVAITSYQGGHIEFFKYMCDLFKEKSSDIKIFGGGGGTILPREMEVLHAYGIARIYSPDDGRALGLQGMINDLLAKCDRPVAKVDVVENLRKIRAGDLSLLPATLTAAENFPELFSPCSTVFGPFAKDRQVPVLGITGTGGSGKSSLVDEFLHRFLRDFDNKTVAIISVDPSRRKTGGALLGDRIRMNAIHNSRVFMRSVATREANRALSRSVQHFVDICKVAGFSLVIVETSGIGQSDSEVVQHSDYSLYVMTPEYGAATQLEKIDMLDYAQVVALNKSDKPGALDAIRDVRKQYRQNHSLWNAADDSLPIVGTVVSKFNDHGMNRLYNVLIKGISERFDLGWKTGVATPFVKIDEGYKGIVPANRVRYLAEIVESLTADRERLGKQAEKASTLYRLWGAIRETTGANSNAQRDDFVSLEEVLAEHPKGSVSASSLEMMESCKEVLADLDETTRALLREWPEIVRSYKADKYRYEVRGRCIEQDLFTETLSGTRVSKVALPRFRDWGDILRWQLTENVPGSFPFTAGVFPLRRDNEDPTRMFAGEGGPERTNRRFHYVSRGMPARRLSTAFDSVTLYGEDPAIRPDIYGKVGNSGVSVATVDDAKRLYSGFDLACPSTSVSMTINGPAPMMLSFFLNAAIDQQCEMYIRKNGLVEDVLAKRRVLFAAAGVSEPIYAESLPDGNDGLGLLLLGVSGDEVLPREVYQKIKVETLKAVRGTIQADILKEDQAQNTCIFSTEFSLRLMGDVQEYFIKNCVRNFYSVSISGYHIAEAGANPVTQLAFTLSNAFTYVEYYLSRGMKIDDFAPSLSFFFSNGIDPEYSVIGRVARRIWAKAIKYRYGGNDRSQKLKYHIQTSGRSLHAQEIAFNDIRTTLQALYAYFDNCNSLHTNAYDEAITTPTEESVRRAIAIQLIISRELGLAKNENPLQGAFVVEELTDLVEQAVLAEFERISERGGVLGAMERMYQRTRIQEESFEYEMQKHSGDLPIVGVNCYLDPKGSPTITPGEVIRATQDEKERAIRTLTDFQKRNEAKSKEALARLQTAAVEGMNLFEAMMEVGKVCSIGQISRSLYSVGGQYRRNM